VETIRLQPCGPDERKGRLNTVSYSRVKLNTGAYFKYAPVFFVLVVVRDPRFSLPSNVSIEGHARAGF